MMGNLLLKTFSNNVLEYKVKGLASYKCALEQRQIGGDKYERQPALENKDKAVIRKTIMDGLADKRRDMCL